ncbi:hypothetical protein DRQ26_07290 [bacterium]|nr:MAG: hypothetical protein DRQ26_07290 [bacterium]
MADFAQSEKINATWKHLFGIVGTSNRDGADGKYWYEEVTPGTHTIIPKDIWADNVPAANTITEARTNATVSGAVVEDRSSGETVTLVTNGASWNITTASIRPEVGYQITDIHPGATYVKSITSVVDNGSGSYTITLSDNTGVAAGSAVLHSRIFLTEDVTTNGLAWFARTIYANHFSNTIGNFIQPQLFGNGYSVRLYQNNGQEVYTTEGAWIFNWQKGLLLLAAGHTANDESYTKPLYIEAFTYVGNFGAGAYIDDGLQNETLRFNGTKWEPSSALLNDGTEVTIPSGLHVQEVLTIPSGAPVSSTASGAEGQVLYDSHYLYLYTSGRWVRSNFQLF